MASLIAFGKAISLGLLIIVTPIAYLAILNQMIPHTGLKFHSGWADNSFQTSMWRLAYNKPVNASISGEEGTLRIHAEGNLSAGTLVSAQRSNGLDFDLAEYRYLKVSIRSSGLTVAARIVIWTDSDHGYTVLLKTYNDNEWHTEIFDAVSFLNILGASSSGLFMIELGWQQAGEGSVSTVWYSQLSFNSLETP